MPPSIESVCCTLCGSDNVRVRYSSVPRIFTPSTQVVECTECGLVYLNPRLERLGDNFAMDEEYLRLWYLPHYQRLGLLTAAQHLDQERNYQFHQSALLQMQDYRRTNRVLDVGCAIGLFLAAAQIGGWQSYGVEPSPHLGTYGRNNLGLSIVEGELSQANFPPDYFDVVTLWDVTEHLLNPVATYQLVNRVLRPGGLLLLRMPNWYSVARELLGPDWDMFVTDHFYYFTPVTLGQLLKQTGFAPKYINASGIVDSEIEEIASKLGPQAVDEARRILSDPLNSDHGSTLTAAAEKPMSTTLRWKKAGNLLRAGAWSTLAQEILSYGRWKLNKVRLESH